LKAADRRQASKQASKFIRQKQYYDNINTKYKQYNGRLPEGNPSIELVA